MTKKKSTKASSTSYLALAAPSTQTWPSEKNLTPGTTGHVVPDYSSVARESRNASINALNVASTSAVNAIKSLDRDDTVAAKFGELLPSAIKAAKAGAEYRKLYNKYQKSNNENYETFAAEQEKETKSSLLLNSEASKQLNIFAEKNKKDNPLEAMRALGLDDNATRLDELKFVSTSLRETVHNALQKQEFTIDGQRVSLESGTVRQRAQIKAIIDSGFYAWLEDNSDFSEKEIFNHVVYPNRKAIQDQLKIDIVDRAAAARQEVTVTLNQNLISKIKGNDSTALGTFLNTKVEALPQENHSETLFSSLDTILKLAEEKEITVSEARKQITNSGPIKIKIAKGDYKTFPNLKDVPAFKSKIQEFEDSLAGIASKQQNDKVAEIHTEKRDLQNKFIPLFRKAQNQEQREEIRSQFNDALKNSNVPWTLLDGEMQNLYNRTITEDQEKNFTIEAQAFRLRISKGEFVSSEEYQHLPREMAESLDQAKNLPRFHRNHPQFNATIDEHLNETVLMKAFQGQSDLSLTPGTMHNIKEEAGFKIGTYYNKYLKDYPDNKEKAMSLALEDFNAYWSSLDQKERFKVIRTWSYPGVGPKAVSTYLSRVQLKNRGALLNAIEKGDYSKILLYTGIPNERLEAELKKLGVKDINNWQTVLSIGYPNSGETAEVQDNLKEWLNNPAGDLKHTNYWNGLHRSIQKQGTNIPQRELALIRARALGLIKTDKELNEKLAIVRETTSKQTDAIENSSNKSTDLCVITEGGANIDEQVYAREIEQPVLDAVASNLIGNPYDYHSTIGEPIIINDEERNLSDLSIYEALEYFGNVDEDQLIGAFRMNESQLREAFAMASGYEDKTFFNAKFDQKTQEKLFQYLMRIKANKQCNTQSIDTTWLRPVPISAEYASLFTDSPNPVSVFNSPSSGFLLPGIIDEQLNTG